MTVRSLGLLVVTSLLLACDSEPSAPVLPDGEYDPITVGWYHDYAFAVGAASPVTVRAQIVAASAGAYTRRTGTPDGAYGETAHLLVNGSEYGEVRTRYTSGGSPVSTDTFSPPYLFLSSDQTPGHSETTVSTVTGAATYQSTREVTVDGIESVTVPAGTFAALKTTAHVTDTLGTDNYNVNWWAPGIGRVKIASYTASNPTNVSTWLLTDYGTAAVP